MQSAFTPIKIRRKRSAAPGEAWKSSKRRRPNFTNVAFVTPSQSTASSVVGSSQNASPRPRKRKRREAELSRLEELPTEIIQSIFEHSGNLQLAMASPVLNRQLSNDHMCHRLTDSILARVIGHVESKAEDEQLATATRLLNSRFMTWTFFRKWLDGLSLSAEEIQVGPRDYAAQWASLQPSDGFCPPAKLLHGPWSSERIAFLRVLSVNVTDIASNSLYHADLAYEGLVQAINEQSVDAVHILLDLGLSTSQELLRQAVIDCGCNQEVVEMLLQRTAHDERYNAGSRQWTRQSTLDTLDPMLWSWIERAERSGDPKGVWLKSLLRAGNAVVE